jgi:hypothetical protein
MFHPRLSQNRPSKLKALKASPVINSFLRWLAIAMTGAGFVIGILQTPNPTIEWWEVLLSAVGVIFVSYMLPFTVDKPTYKGKITEADFFPLKSSWPVILFWGAVIGFASYLGIFLRGLFQGAPVFEVLVVEVIYAVWIWLVYKGKLKRWTSTGVRKSDCANALLFFFSLLYLCA